MAIESQKYENRKRAILALSQAKGIGYHTIKKIYGVKKDIEEVIEYSFNDLIALFERAKVRYSENLAHSFYDSKQKALDRADEIIKYLFVKQRIQFILDDEQSFPESLKKIPLRPLWLFVEGDVSLLKKEKMAAVVGTRHPTPKGIRIAEELTQFLVENEFVIVSGLAEGIDAAAHEKTNQMKGKGVAVLGCGINLGFPARTFGIRKALVANGGAVISEYMVNDSYSKEKFVLRDRLQSGLANVVFPIQGTLKSGTVHTIKFSEQQNKRVVGVFLDNIENIPQNELFEYLRDKKHSIFDLKLDKEKILSEFKVDPSESSFGGTTDLFHEKISSPPASQKEGLLKKLLRFFGGNK